MVSRLLALPATTITVLIASLFLFDFEYAWFMIFGTIGFVFCCASFVFPLLWFKKVPEPARMLTRCAQTGEVPALVVHDSGRSKLISITEKLGEGVVKTDQGNYRILPRFVKVREVLKGVVDKAEAAKKLQDLSEETTDLETAEVPSTLPTETELDKFKELLKGQGLEMDYYGDFLNRRSILIGLGLPIYTAYSGKMCLINPLCLALYHAGEMFIPTADKPDQSDIPEADRKPMPMMLLDSTEMKTIINHRYDTSQVNAAIIDAVETGKAGLTVPAWALPVATIAILAVAAVAALVFLSGGFLG